MRYVAVILLLGMTGCATVGEMRTQPPVKSGAFEGSYKTMALCAFDGLENGKVMFHGVLGSVASDAHKQYRLLDKPPARAEVLATAQVYPSGTVPKFELVFEQAGAVVNVDMRTTDGGYTADVWSLIEQCAKPL